MKRRTVQSLHVWFSLCIALLLSCCGKGGDASNTLHLKLKTPANYSSANFWIGVEEKTLFVESASGEPLTQTPWNNRMSLDLHEGDHLRFEGRDGKGNLLVSGEASVGKEDTLWLPVERVL